MVSHQKHKQVCDLNSKLAENLHIHTNEEDGNLIKLKFIYLCTSIQRSFQVVKIRFFKILNLFY